MAAGTDPSPARFQEQFLRDATIQASAQDWLDIECYQVDRGPYSGNLSRLEIPGADLVIEQQDRCIQKLGRIPDDRCTVSVITDTTVEAGWFQQSAVGDGSLFFLPGGTEFDVYLPGRIRTLYIAFEQVDLMAALRALAPGDWSAPPADLLALQTPRRNGFIHTALTVLTGFRHHRPPGLAGNDLRRSLLDSAALALNGGRTGETVDTHPRWRKLQAVRRTREHMHDCLEADRQPSMVDLCAAAGVSERTLEYGFRDLLGITPIAYWRILRLNRVRDMLLQPETADLSVTTAAMRCGFLHLGRFARDYRRQFGETPSRTLSRGLA